MPPPPKVSVIIPTYNRAHFILEAIQSVLAQTYADYEIIVVDDGSTDNTKDVLRTYGDKLKYFYQNNRGPAAARNLAISKSEGEYIAFLDSDDVWMPNRLEVQVPVLDDNPDLAFICSDARVVDSRGREINIWRKAKNNNKTFESLREENFISTLTVLMRRACFNAVGGFDETLPCVV